MPLAAYKAIFGLGIFFIIFGITAIFFSRREEGKYYNSVLTQRDIKEYISHEPKRPWLKAWQIGGKISLILGIPLAITGGVLWLVLY